MEKPGFFALLLAMSVSCVLSQFWQPGSVPINDSQLQDLFSYVFRDSYCVEVFTDKSKPSEGLLRLIHESSNAPSVVFMETTDKEAICRDRVFIYQNLDSLWHSLWKHKSREIRFFVFLIDVNRKLLGEFMRVEESHFFGYSAGHVIELTDPKKSYKYNIVENKFSLERSSDIPSFELCCWRHSAPLLMLYYPIHSLTRQADCSGPCFVEGKSTMQLLSGNFAKYCLFVFCNKNSYLGKKWSAGVLQPLLFHCCSPSQLFCLCNKENIGNLKDVVHNFGGKQLKVATFNCSIHSLVGPKNKNGKPEFIGGVELQFFDILSKKLNFTYEIKIPPGKKKHGSVNENGTWTKYGVIGMVGDREVDVGFCSIWASSFLRRSQIELAVLPAQMCIEFLVPRRKVEAKNGRGLTMPFSLDTWIFLSLTILLVPLLFFTSAHFIRFSLKWNDSNLIKRYTSYQYAFLNVWGMILINSPRSIRQLGPLRHLLNSWALTGLIIGTFYSCSLRSSLLRVTTGRSYDTIKQMVEGNLYWVMDYKMNFKFLFNMDDHWHKKWIRLFKEMSIKEQCKLIKSGSIAVLATIHKEGVTTYQELPCTKDLEIYQASRECLVRLNTAFLLQHESPYTKIFSKYAQSFDENGGFQKEYGDYFHLLSLKERYILQTLEPLPDIVTKEVKLGMYNMLSTIYLVFLGDIIGFIVFILEWVWYYRHQLAQKFFCR